MKMTSTGIQNGIIADLYGKRGKQFSAAGLMTFSLPLKIEDAPENTITFALVMEDKDAVPVCGFSWIHWTVANLVRTELEENESIRATDFVQGTNSLSGRLGGVKRLDASFYDGPSPPNAPHMYEIHLFALDTMLDLKRGFYMNELYHAMDGHILDQYTLKGVYRN